MSEYIIINITMTIIGIFTNAFLIGAFVFTINKSSARSIFLLSSIAFVSFIVTMGMFCLGYVHAISMIQKTIAAANDSNDAIKAMYGIADCDRYFNVGLWLSIMPLVFGVYFLIRGMLTLPVQDARPRTSLQYITLTSCLTVGLCLSIIAFVDYLRYEEFFILFFLIGH